MSNFHINERGEVNLCAAKTPESCPVKNINGVKSEHYKTKVAAEKASQVLLSKNYGETETLSKTNFNLKILKNSYIGIPVQNWLIEKMEKDLKNLNIDNIEIYMKNRENRDLGKYHMTVISPKEFRELKKRGVDVYKIVESFNNFCFTFKGIGMVEDGDNKAWFVIVSSEDVDNFREELNLPKKDLHITLAFKNKDIHHSPKDEKTLIK